MATEALDNFANTAGERFSRGWLVAGDLSFTGTTITVGPLAGSNYPYILLDRAMIVVWHLASGAHA